MNLNDLARLFDSYNRVARLYPAFLCLLPAVAFAFYLFPHLFGDSLPRNVVTFTCIAGLLYFLASVARWRGKVLEPKLIVMWGGWPTTTLLRHGDTTIDILTKARYRSALVELCPGIQFPTEEEELANLAHADSVYRSATKCLMEARRDKKYWMVHAENASYGFRRNMLGLRPIALCVSAVVGLMTIAVWLSAPGASFSLAAMRDHLAHSWILPLFALLDVAYGLLWLTVVRASFVRQAAFEYAAALFRTLDGV